MEVESGQPVDRPLFDGSVATSTFTRGWTCLADLQFVFVQGPRDVVIVASPSPSFVLGHDKYRRTLVDQKAPSRHH